MHKDHDLALIEDCKKGDQQALASLVRRYERPVYNVAYRMLGTADEAADVSQTTFLKAFENLNRYNPEYKFFSWIYRIAVNESINQLNRRKRLGELGDDEVAPGEGPDESVDTDKLSVQIQAALAALSEDHRAVVVLRHFSEHSYRDIAMMLQIPEKTVKSRLFSARKAMKVQLEGKGVSL